MAVISVIADFAGAAATVFVAWLVYRLDRKQHGETHAAAERQLELDRQNLRLSMLERRSVAIEAFEMARTQWHLNGQPTDEMLGALQRSSFIASLLFDSDLRRRLTELSQELVKHRLFGHRIDIAERRGDEDQRQKAIDDQFAAEDRILKSLQSIGDDMINASRIDEAYLTV